MSRERTQDVDVLIIGGGLVGGALACALAGSGVDVAVVDRDDPETLMQAGYDGRCSAIALACKRVLEAAGLWAHMADSCAPIREIRVSDGPSLLFLHYDHKALGPEPFGYMAENRIMRKAVFARFKDLPRVLLFAPKTITRLERTSLGVEAALSGGAQVRARLVVGADGRGSATRRGAGIGVTRWDYHQSAIVLTVRHERSHRYVAQEHFLTSGPFAILPLPGGHRSSIVWTERTHLAKAILALDEAAFLRELKWRFGDFLGAIEVVGPRWSYPLSLQYAARTIDRRLALVGDAAHGMHPIAGQGMNYGLRDVAALAEAVVEAKRLGMDVGDSTVLERYARRRRFDTMLMLGMTDVLNRLFSNDIGPVRLARDLGLAAVDLMPPLKRFFMRHAMGEVGDLPRMMRGLAP